MDLSYIASEVSISLFVYPTWVLLFENNWWVLVCSDFLLPYTFDNKKSRKFVFISNDYVDSLLVILQMQIIHLVSKGELFLNDKLKEPLLKAGQKKLSPTSIFPIDVIKIIRFAVP